MNRPLNPVLVLVLVSLVAMWVAGAVLTSPGRDARSPPRSAVSPPSVSCTAANVASATSRTSTSYWPPESTFASRPYGWTWVSRTRWSESARWAASARA
jgi:hypothetical protein